IELINRNEILNSTCTSVPELTTDTFKSVRTIGQQILEQNITHWFQLTNPNTLKILNLPELSETMGIRYNRLHTASWEKLIKTVTDSNGQLLSQFRPNTNINNSNCSNLILEPKRMEGNDSTQFVFTDGSVKNTHHNTKIAVSAAFFDNQHPSNTVFRTVGPQTI